MTDFEKRTGKEIREIVLNIRDDITNLVTGETIIMNLVKREIKAAFSELPEGFVNTYKSSGIALSEFIYEIFLERGIE